MRRLEPLALWDERELFTEQGKKERGFLGYIRCCFIFDDSTVQKDDSEWNNTDPVIEYELEDMLHNHMTEQLLISYNSIILLFKKFFCQFLMIF